MLSRSTKIAIIGLGLIGGSYAKGLSKSNYNIIGIDIDEETLKFAREYKWINEGGNNPELVSDADIVIFALYPSDFIEWIKNNQKYFKKNAIITDVTGVKESIISSINEILRDDVEFIASHPMAGKEVSGIKYSDTSMFNVANFIIVPTEKNTEKAINTVKDIAKILKFKNIVILSPKEHDVIIGYVSQLTHVIAVSLMNCRDNDNLVNYTGDSFRDLTRIAKINDKLWTELFILNKNNLIDEINGFIQTLEHFKNSLNIEDREEMKKLFNQSTERRKRFDKNETISN